MNVCLWAHDCAEVNSSLSVVLRLAVRLVPRRAPLEVSSFCCGLSPSGSGIQRGINRACAVLGGVFSGVKFGVLTHLKHLKEAPMKHAFMLAIRTVLFEVLWTLGTSYVPVALPG